MTTVTYATNTHIAVSSRIYPEVLQAMKEQLLDLLRRSAKSGGLDITTERDLTWPAPTFYRWEQTGEEEAERIECPESEATFSIIFVEATYEMMPRG